MAPGKPCLGSPRRRKPRPGFSRTNDCTTSINFRDRNPRLSQGLSGSPSCYVSIQPAEFFQANAARDTIRRRFGPPRRRAGFGRTQRHPAMWRNCVVRRGSAGRQRRPALSQRHEHSRLDYGCPLFLTAAQIATALTSCLQGVVSQDILRHLDAAFARLAIRRTMLRLDEREPCRWTVRNGPLRNRAVAVGHSRD
jgi:hypothetical protein